MPAFGHDTLKTRRTLNVGGKDHDYFSLAAAAEGGLGDVTRLPFSLKVLLENLLRWEDGRTVTTEDVAAVVAWLGDRLSGKSEQDKAEFNDGILSYGPGNDRAWAFLRGAISRIDPSRTDIETFAALTVLDDKVFFARFKVGV